ncbi:MAG: serine/threonine-protein kinase [Planctomycetota bacterium]|nr:serine/threonine-protein kinase [Planctomycetota bacterium]
MLRNEIMLGQMAIEHKFISPQQLKECIEEQERSPFPPPLGAIIVRKGFMPLNALHMLLSLQQKRLDENSPYAEMRRRDVLFGRLLVDYGLASQDQVNECLRLQARLAPDVNMRLGELMVKKGHISEKDVHLVLEFQNKRILMCRGCKTQFNIASYTPNSQVKCPKCGEVLDIPDTGSGATVQDTVFMDKESEGAGSAAALKGDVPPLPTVLGGEKKIAGEPTDSSLKSDTTIRGTPFGNYELLRELGRGAAGRVFKAWQRDAKRLVAVKVLNDQDLSPAAIERFTNESASITKLAHPGIIQVTDSGVHAGRHYYAMEYVRGMNFKQVLKSERPQVGRILQIVKDVATAVQHAHDSGLVHGDIKPQNILIDEDGVTKLGDFGLAFDMSTMRRQERYIAGTPAYMAPEQARGDSHALDARTDIYGLGAVLFEALTKIPPFEGDSAEDVIRKILEEPVAPPSKINPAIHRDIEAILLKALHKEPAKRYQSAAELAADIQRYLDAETVMATQKKGLGNVMDRVSTTFRRRKHHVRVAVWMFVVILVALVAAEYFLKWPGIAGVFGR